MKVYLAASPVELTRCFPIVVQLRPHLDCPSFIEQVQRQQQEGYQLGYVEAVGAVKAIAGFRITEMLSCGRCLCVDDLVTDQQVRSQGYGDFLLNWLIAHAKSQKCDRFALDSGVERAAAHRFYFRHRLVITAYHFAMNL